MPTDLPPRPNLEQLKKQAKELLRAIRAGEPGAIAKFRSLDTARAEGDGGGAAAESAKLADAQRLVAREYGFPSWSKLKAHVESVAPAPAVDPLEEVKAAFGRDDAAAVRELLRRHPPLRSRVNEPVLAFDSPPIIHVRSPAMLDVLLEAGADINGRSRWWAGSFGLLDCASPEVSAYAIKRGAIVDAHAAARLGIMDRLRELVDADPNVVHARGGDGQTPLHFASTVEVAEFLLDRGAAIDARDVDHESTPAQWMLRDRQDVARYLVTRGCHTDLLMAAALGDVDRVRAHLDADPDSIRMSVTERWFPKQNPRAGGMIYIWTLGANKTAHLIAREFGHDDVFRMLLDRSPMELKLSLACELGDEPTFEALLASRPDLVKTLSDDDRRKLVDAAQNSNAEAVRLMLQAGWPVDARGQHGATALHWAAWHGNAGIVREILRYNPPIEDAANDFKGTPLGWAMHGSENSWHCKTGDYAGVLELLCKAGARVPEVLAGTEEVKEVLRRYQEAKNG